MIKFRDDILSLIASDKSWTMNESLEIWLIQEKSYFWQHLPAVTDDDLGAVFVGHDNGWAG